MYKTKLTVGTPKWPHNFISVYNSEGVAISLKSEVPAELLASYAPESGYDSATYEWFEGEDDLICKEFNVYMQPQGFNALVRKTKRTIPVKQKDILSNYVAQVRG